MEDILHRIRVNLYENYLTDNANDYSAKVISERSLSVKEICQTAVKRGGAPSTAEAMEHNVGLFLKEMAYQLMDGYSVNAGYFTANTTVRGVFENAKENFDPQKHSILFRFNQGELLRKQIPNVSVQVMGVGDTSIQISHVIDTKTGSVNDLITPNGTLKIKGGKLKIVGDNPQVGVYFERIEGTEGDDAESFKVSENDIVVNNPAELIVVIPPLEKGSYRLVVCNQFSGGGIPLKEVRSSKFDKMLSVQ
ncbi:MAG: DUF4469 domain-containing protein [Lentimicrobiaceae bacterium]|nr:DUF4469 domain-containing protein [Lentimicrobiaceae bacterium]